MNLGESLRPGPGAGRAKEVSSASVKAWLDSHADGLALAVVALGLAARLSNVRGAYLMPDELSHLNIASARDLAGVYRASLASAHPPLFMLLLHFWKEVARSEWSLRLLPAAFGAASVWEGYRWAGALFGKAAALATAALLALLPSLVIASAELRAYGLLLFLITAALSALEHALETRQPRGIVLFAALGSLALLTHYWAILFLISALVYAAVRVLTDRYPAPFVRAWITTQGAVAALFLFLYASHISRLRGGESEVQAQTDWLRSSYFLAGQESPLRFCLRQTAALFQYLFSSRAAGMVGLGLLLVGAGGLVLRRRASALLLVLPVLASAAAGLLRLYPYGGTRHSIGLAPFVAAAVGVAGARLAGDRLWVAALLAAALAPAAFAAAG